MKALLTISLLVLVLTVGAGTVAAGSSRAGDEPNPIVGATYRFSAAAGAGSASGKGQLDLDGTFEATVRASRRGNGETVTIVARVAKFWLSYIPPRKRLTFIVEVTRGSSQCPKGSRGTVVLVDDESADTVRTRFVRVGCSPFEGSWTSTASGQRVAVRITVLQEPSGPSSNVSRVAPAGGGEPVPGVGFGNP